MTKGPAKTNLSIGTKRALVIVLPIFFIASFAMGFWSLSSAYPLEASDVFVWYSVAIGLALFVLSIPLARSGRIRAAKLALLFAVVLPIPLMSLLGFVNYVADGRPEPFETTVLSVHIHRQPGQTPTSFAQVAPLPGQPEPEYVPICKRVFDVFDGRPDAPATVYYGPGALGAPWLDQDDDGCLRLEPRR